MRLMLWLEPERAMDITEVTKAHPEWFLKLENKKIPADINYEDIKGLRLEAIEKLNF